MTMDPAAFRRMLDVHGADPARWPDIDRDPALALVARSASARAALEQARRLDSMLSQGLVAQAGIDLRRRIALGAQGAEPSGSARRRAVTRDRLLDRLLASWQLGAAAAAAASVALGMMVGLEVGVATILYGDTEEPMDLAAITYGQVAGIEDVQ